MQDEEREERGKPGPARLVSVAHLRRRGERQKEKGKDTEEKDYPDGRHEEEDKRRGHKKREEEDAKEKEDPKKGKDKDKHVDISSLARAEGKGL